MNITRAHCRYRCAMLMLFLIGALGCHTTKQVLKQLDVMQQQSIEMIEHSEDIVWVVDLCATWSADCVRIATALSEACDLRCSQNVRMMSVLFDDTDSPAIDVYKNRFAFHQEVFLAGEELRSGEATFGEVGQIPRMLMIDRSGQIVLDERVTNLSAVDIIQKVDELLVD